MSIMCSVLRAAANVLRGLVSRELTDDLQVDEGFCPAVFVLDDDLVAALVGLRGVLQSVLGAIGRRVDVVSGETQVVVQPVGLGLWVGAVGDGHDDGLPGVRDVALVCGLYLRHSWRGRSEVRKANAHRPFCFSVRIRLLPASSSLALASLSLAMILYSP